METRETEKERKWETVKAKCDHKRRERERVTG